VVPHYTHSHSASDITDTYEAYCARHGVTPLAWGHAYDLAQATRPLPCVNEQYQYRVSILGAERSANNRDVYDVLKQYTSRPEAVIGVRVTYETAFVWVDSRERERLDKLLGKQLEPGVRAAAAAAAAGLGGECRLVLGKSSPAYGINPDNYFLVTSGLILQLEEGRDGVLYHRLV
jgi:hypothetical protein